MLLSCKSPYSVRLRAVAVSQARIHIRRNCHGLTMLLSANRRGGGPVLKCLSAYWVQRQSGEQVELPMLTNRLHKLTANRKRGMTNLVFPKAIECRQQHRNDSAQDEVGDRNSPWHPARVALVVAAGFALHRLPSGTGTGSSANDDVCAQG